MAELGVGYISIVPEVSKITPGIAKALGAAEPDAAKAGQSLGTKLSAGLGKTLKAGAVGAGAAVGGVLAGGIAKGMGRLTGIENAQASLRGLGHDADSVKSIMNDALASVKGTAFGLETAAGVAASAVAAGIEPGKDLERTLKLVGDAATIAGVDMGQMGSIVNKVATSDMMQMDVANQLMDAGIPILQMVADEMGVTADEARKMASDGKISFETFQNALEKGVGGAALEAGDTFKGALANVGAALGRLGATSLSPFFDLAKGGMKSATGALDALEGKIKPLASGLSDWLQSTAVPAVKDFGQSLVNLQFNPTFQAALTGAQQAIEGLVSAGQALWPVVVDIASSMSQATAALGVATWDLFVGTLRLAAQAVESLAGPLGAVAGFLNDHPGMVAAAVAAWAGFKTVPGVVTKIQSAMTGMDRATSGHRATVQSIVGDYRVLQPEIGRTGAAMRALGKNSATVRSMQDAFIGASSGAKGFKDAIVAGVTPAMDGLKNAGRGVMNALGGPMGVALLGVGVLIADAQKSAAALENAQKNLASATRDGAAAQEELRVALAGTTGAMGEQELEAAAKVVKASLAELTEIGGRDFGLKENLDQITVGFDSFLSKIPGMTNEAGRAQAEAAQSVKETRKAYEALEQGVEESGLAMEDLNAIVAKGGAEYDKLVAHLRNSGEEGSRAADQLESAKAELDAITEAARRLDPAAAQAAEGINVLADSAASGEEKLKALESVMQAMGLAPKDAERAMMDAAKAVDEIVKKTEEAARPIDQMGDALFGANGKLQPTNEGARDLAGSLDTLRGKLQDVAINGGDTRQAFEDMQPALQGLQREFGLSDEQMKRLIEQFGLMPDEINTAVNVNTEGVSSDLATVWAQLYPLKDGQTIEISAVSDEAKQVLDDLNIQWEMTADGKNMKITATTDEAKDALSTLSQQMAELGETEISPSVFLDTSRVQSSAQQAKAILQALDLENPTPQADLIIDKLQKGVDISHGELAYLAAQSPTPIADLNKQLLDNGVTMSKTSLDQLGAKRATPTVDVNNQPAKNGIEAVKAWLGGIKDKVVNIFTRRQGDGHADGGVVGLAAGGHVGHALGYRLPMAGPGTSEVDGFQGVDGYGRPTARVDRGEWVINRKSSTKHHGMLRAINNDDPRLAGVWETLQRLETGGVVKSAKAIKKAVAYMDGTPYVMGGFSPAATDCSGAVALTVNAAQGKPHFESRMSTVTEGSWLSARGFKRGRGGDGDIRVGWWDQGGGANGHTAMQLQDGTFIESGGNTGGGFTIGKKAGPLTGRGFTDFMHLTGGVNIETYDKDGEYDYGDPLTGGSSGGSSGGARSVSWGEAADLFKRARDYLDRVPTYDTGGRWPSGTLGRNVSGKDELVLTNQNWRELSRTAAALPPTARSMESAASLFTTAVEGARKDVQTAGRHFGGGYLSNAVIVQDAEKGLLETRRAVADQADGIKDAEKELSEAREELKKAEKAGGGLSTSDRRKLADAEEAVAKARKSGKADQIAAAEKRLARAREDANASLEKSKDKNAKEVKKAQERVNKAEDKLAKTRQDHEDVLKDLEAAERTVSAARYQAAADLATGLTEAMATGVDSLAAFFDEMGRLAGIVEKTRQDVSKLQMQQQTNALERVKALQDLQIKEWDVARTRARGAVAVAKAEQELEDARAAAALMGATSIEAMEGAMDRFYRTGKFAIGEVTEDVIRNSKLVQAAEWGVKMAQAQNALDMLEATHTQAQAQHAVAEATMKQTYAAQMLQAQTDALAQQTAQLYGLTANQATGASRGFGGISRMVGGIGKIIGGALAGLAGFAVGGPLGALAGAGMAMSGLGDAVKGGIDIHTNKKEMSEAWKGMGTGAKTGLVLGTVGGTALTLGGAAASTMYGPEMAVGGAELGSKLMDATIGGVQYGIGARIEKSQRDMEDTLAKIQQSADVQSLNLALAQAQQEVEYLKQKDKLSAELEYATLQQEIAKSDSKRVQEALEMAASVEALRAQSAQSGEVQAEELKKLNATLADLLTVTKQSADAANKARQEDTYRLVGGLSAVDAATYVGARR